MQSGESNGPTFMDKLKGFGSKLDLKDRAQEGATITRLNQAVGGAGDLATQALHRTGEVVDKVGGKVDEIGDRFGQAGQYLKKTGENISDSFHGDLSDDVILAGARKFGAGVLGRIQTSVQEIVMRKAGEASTFLNENVVQFVKKVKPDMGSVPFLSAFDNLSDVDGSKKKVEKSGGAEIAETPVIEGNQLVDMVMKDLQPAVNFDRLKDEAIPALLEQAMGGTELARKIAPELMRVFTAIFLTGSSFDGKTVDAQAGLRNLLANKDAVAEMKRNQVDLADLGQAFLDALDEISGKRELVIKARGESKNLSFEYEGKLAEKSEEFQKEASKFAKEIINSLPVSAAELNINHLIAARANSLDFARKVNEAMLPLKSIAKSMEIRFPDKVAEIREALSQVMSKWTESKGVARDLMNEVKVDPATSERVGKDVLSTIVEPNKMFQDLSKEQQATVMDMIGIKLGNEGEAVDRVPGSLYDRTCQAHEEYTRLAVCYDKSREYVLQHPEAADILMVLAERVMQAESVMELAKNKMSAEVLVQSRKIKNQAEFASEKQGNLTTEAQNRINRKESYAIIFDRHRQRVEDEGPTVEKIAKILGAAGVAVVVGREVGPEAINALVEVAKMVAKVAMDNLPMITEAAAAGGGLWGITKLYGWARKQLGQKSGEAAYGALESADKDKAAALNKLIATRDEMNKLNQPGAAGEIQKLIDQLNNKAG